MTHIELMRIPEKIKINGFSNGKRIFIDGIELMPIRSQVVLNHSPDGFNWGFTGSGPAQLALAILLEYLPKKETLMLYQNFKDDVIRILPQNKNFTMDIKLRNIIQKMLA